MLSKFLIFNFIIFFVFIKFIYCLFCWIYILFFWIFNIYLFSSYLDFNSFFFYFLFKFFFYVLFIFLMTLHAKVSTRAILSCPCSETKPVQKWPSMQNCHSCKNGLVQKYTGLILCTHAILSSYANLTATQLNDIDMSKCYLLNHLLLYITNLLKKLL